VELFGFDLDLVTWHGFRVVWPAQYLPAVLSEDIDAQVAVDDAHEPAPI